MRRKADPVDVAFDHWKALDTEQQQHFADQQRGYLGAMAVQSGAPVVRTRQRKAKPNGGAYSPEETVMHPLNPPKGGSGVPPKTA